MIKISYAGVTCYLTANGKIEYEIPMNMTGHEFVEWKRVYGVEAERRVNVRKKEYDIEISNIEYVIEEEEAE